MTKDTKVNPVSDNEKGEKVSRLTPLKELLLNISTLTNWAIDNTADEQISMKGKRVREGYKRTKGNAAKEIFSRITVDEGRPIKLDILDVGIIVTLDSEFEAGNDVITFERLYRDLGGCQHYSKSTRALLHKRVNKLMGTVARIDISEMVENFYPKTQGERKTIVANLIDAETETHRINGRIVSDVIRIKDSSPFYRYAGIKGQIARTPAEITQVPLNLNENNLLLLWGLLDSVTRIVRSNSDKRGKRAKRLNPLIRFETLLHKYSIKVTDTKAGCRVREYISKILDHFATCKLIAGYRIEKRDNGYCINLDLA